MARKTGTSTEHRVPLSRERVLSAAITLADEAGIESLSMRKLAQELGVEAMSLYNHVANKDDLLDGIVEVVAGEMAGASGGADWKAAVRKSAISAHETLLRHPWASGLWMRQRPSSASLRHGDSILGSLRDAGFSKDLTYHAYHLLEGYILGYTIQVLNFRSVDTEVFAGTAASFVRGDYADEFPHFTEHVLQHMEPRDDDVSAFELGLDLILDGLERLRDTT
jgi:AcrR family transcriptional regulator